MADFRIRLQTTVEKGNVESELNSLIKTLENKKIKLGINASDFKNQIQGIQSALNNAFKLDRSQLNSLNTLKSTLKEINKLSRQANKKIFGDSGASQEAKSISALSKKYDQLLSKKQSIEKQLSSLKVGNLSTSQAKEVDRLKSQLKSLDGFKIDTKDIAKSRNELTQLESKLKEVKSNLGNLKIDMNIDKQINGAKTSVDGLINKLQALNKTGFGNTGKINETVSKLQSLKNELNNLNPNSENFTAEFQRMVQSINQCESEYKQLNSAMQSSKANFNFQTNLSRTLSELQQLRQRCVDLGQSTGNIDRLEQELRQLGNVSTDKAASGLQRIKSEMATMKSSMSGLNTAGSGVQKMFGNLYSTMTTFSLGNMLAMQIQRGVYAIGSTIVDLDSAFRDLMKVAPDSFRGTSKDLNELKNNAISAGQEVAKSSVDIIESTAAALQSGFKNVDEGLKYAKESAKFSNVSDMSQEDTDKSLRSILSAYGGVENSLKGVRTEIQGTSKDYSMLNQVMDVSNFIGNNYSTSTQNVAEGMQTAGASLKTMGASVTDGMAYFAAIDEIMQNSGKSANGLKAIAQNMTGITVSAKDGSLKLNKSALAMKEYANVNMQKPSGELRDMGDVLDELGGKWKTLNKTQKQALMVAIGGKQRSSQFSALMDNWETVKKIQQEVASGQALGSADKENQRYIDSIQGRIVKLKEEFKKLVTTTISTDMAKGFVSGLTSMVSGINNVIGAFDKLGVATPVVLSGLTGMFMTIKSLGTGTQLPNFFKTITGITTAGSSLNKIQNNLKNTSTQFTNLSRTSSKFSGVMRATQGSSNQMSKALQTNRVVATQTANGYSVMSKTASQAKSSLSGMGSVLSGIGSTLLTTFGNMAIMAVAGMAISKITEELYKFAHASEISMEKHEENISKINTKISELKTQKSSLKSISKEYDELANKTNRSAKEQERYNELRNQIAEANPELQSGVDSEGNAILSLNGSLKNYIKSLDSAIEKQRMLLQQQQNAEAGDASDQLQKGGNVAFGYDYKNYQKATMTAEEEKKKIEKSGLNLTDAINSFTAKSEDSFDNSVKKIQTAREEHTAQIEESYNKVAEEQEKINELSSKLKQKALNKIETNTKIEKSGDDIKALAKNITSSLDFSSLKTGQIDTFARNLSNALGDGEVDGVLQKYQNLRKEVERTGDTFAYKSGVEEIIPQMADLLGLNDELVRSMVQLDPTLTQATSSLDAYLQSFGKRESMREFDADTESLAKQYESFNTLMDDLGGLDATKSETNGEVRFDLKAVAEIVNKDDVPKQVKDLFGDMEKDGQFTNEEMQVMMKISAGMTSEDSQERSQLLDEAQKMIDELFPDSKIDVGELDIQAEYKMNEDSKNAVSEQIKSLGDEKFVATIETEIHGTNDAEKFSQIMSSLQGDKGDIQTFITANIDKLGELKSYEDVVKWLLNNPEIANKYNISVVGADTVDAVAKKVNKLDLSKKEKKQIMVDVQQGNISGLMAKLDEMPPEKKVKVLSEISQAISGIDTVDARVLHNKFTDLLAIDNASGKINYLDEYKKLMKKDVNINGHDNATSVINAVPTGDVTKTIWVEVKKVVSDAWGWITGGNAAVQRPKSVGGFSNVSDTPQEASAMSSGFSGVSDSPTASASAPTPTTSAPSGVSGQVSAKSTGSFGSVLTSSTLATKISTSYKNVWNTLKYGINLFQELENRISRTQNNLDLLSTKLENAVGTKKISYLKTQNKLYAEQAKLQKSLFSYLNKEKSSVGKKLKGLGFSINKQGNLTSYEEKLLKLEQAAEKAEKKASSYEVKSSKKSSKKSEKVKKSLEKSADKAKQKLDDAKKLTEEYLKLQYTEIPNAEKEWYELQNAIKETNNEIEQMKFEDKIYKEKNAIDELNNSIKQYSHYRDRLSTKADRSQGATKIKYLKEEAQHLKKLQELNEKLHNQYASQRKDYRGKLSSYGAKFDSGTGQLTNYDEILNKYQNSSNLEKVKKWMEEYQDILDAERDTNDLRQDHINDMQDLQNEIKKLELDSSLKPFSTSVEVANSKIKKLQNNLDIINIKMEHAYGNDKLNLIKEQISLYEKLNSEQKNVLENMKKEEEILKKELEKSGFKFNSTGEITNMKDALSKIEKSGAYEYLKEVLEQWKDLHENEIPDADKSIEDFQNSIKDAYKDQLETTKDIEGKISDMIKKEIEDRKDAIQKETDTIKKELEKRKKAHQDARKEADYQNEYDEKTSEIDKLKEQLETAKKDSSLGNRKKIAELEKQLADAQKDLEKLVDDKLNSDIEDAFDDAIEGVEEENDKKIEDLEKEWTDSKIAEAIKNALDTNLFTDLNGNVTNLQDAMLDFAESSGEALGIMGDVIKNDLIANLNIALDTLKNYADISDKLGLNNVNSNLPTANTSSKSVTTGDININITTQSNANETDIANAAEKAVNKALQGAVQGL